MTIASFVPKPDGGGAPWIPVFWQATQAQKTPRKIVDHVISWLWHEFSLLFCRLTGVDVMSQQSYEFYESLPEAVAVIDPHANRVVYLNGRAERLLGVGPNGGVLGSAVYHFGAALPQLVAFTQEVLCRREGLCDELCGRTAAGKELNLEVSAQCLEAGGQTLICLCLRDRDGFSRWRTKSSAQKQHALGPLPWHRIHEVFQQIERENHLILNAAGEGIYGVDAQGNTTFLNPAAERLLGFRAEELIGTNVHAAVHHSHADGSDYHVHGCPIYAAFKDGAARRVDDEVFWHKSGRPFAVEYTSTPIFDNGQLVGAVVVFSDISARSEAQAQLRSALAEVEHLKHRLELENAYLQEEISAGYNHSEIIGRNPAMQGILHQISLVAPTDATVLITGESGTGKELIARAIYTASERHHRPMVRVNCAAIPAELFESEFFGHVRGAFSGALQDRVGRFQLADGGTLFLDEVGEIPLGLQGKLLRVLQDGEFERVGESITRTVSVRVIAATNRNLLQRVREGKFREDLYFRLNVFAIHSVPLRERRDDLPLLATHFLAKVCQRFGKPSLKLSLAQLQRLQDYAWPGNIRELQNLIERQVILSRGHKLVLEDLPVRSDAASRTLPAELSPPATALTEADCNSLRRQAIIRALTQTRGRLYGEGGAAQALGVKPTTLASRLKKLGIDRRQFTN